LKDYSKDRFLAFLDREERQTRRDMEFAKAHPEFVGFERKQPEPNHASDYEFYKARWYTIRRHIFAYLNFLDGKDELAGMNSMRPKNEARCILCHRTRKVNKDDFCRECVSNNKKALRGIGVK
jgi:hypothetical protein